MEHTFSRRTRSAKQLTRIRLQEIDPNSSQPRRDFSHSGISSLAASIRRYGLLSPLIVRRNGLRYELIAGERRLRALRLLGEEETDAIVLTVADRESALLALIENLQRENLSFFEEAEAYQALIDTHRLTREELSQRVGRSPSSIANRLRLLRLPPSVRAVICTHSLTERHARALLRLSSEEDQLSALDRVIRAQLNVRSLEQLIDRMVHEQDISSAAPSPIRCVWRDHRIFVNTMMNTVRSLQESGVGVTSRIIDRADGVEITVVIPRVSRPAAQKEDTVLEDVQENTSNIME